MQLKLKALGEQRSTIFVKPFKLDRVKNENYLLLDFLCLKVLRLEELAIG